MVERDLFRVITMSKYVLKVIVHYIWLDSRSNMVITALLIGVLLILLLAISGFLSSCLVFLFFFLVGSRSRLHMREQSE